MFDIGIRNNLANIERIVKNTREYGEAFEHFIALELRAYISYMRCRLKLSYWRTKHGYEVDFIVGDEVAIEVKATDRVQDKHLKTLLALEEEQICNAYYLVSFDRVNRKKGNIQIIYWQDFLEKLWLGDISFAKQA